MMSNALAQHGRALRSSLRELGKQPLATVLNLLVIAVALALPLGLYLLLGNAQRAAGNLPTEPQISVYLHVEAQAQDIDRVRHEIQKLPGILRVRFISKAQALEILQQQTGRIDILAGLDGNPLPDAFVLTLKQRDEATSNAIAADLLALPAVEQVQHDAAWQKRLLQWLTFGEQLVGLLAALLGLATVAATGNTIRLQILTRRDEIEVARLFGATSSFIRRPFLYHAWLQGLLGGGLALLIILAAGAWINPHVSALAESYGSHFLLHGPTSVEAGAVLGCAVLLSSLGAWLAVNRHLARQ